MHYIEEKATRGRGGGGGRDSLDGRGWRDGAAGAAAAAGAGRDGRHGRPASGWRPASHRLGKKCSRLYLVDFEFCFSSLLLEGKLSAGNVTRRELNLRVSFLSPLHLPCLRFIFRPHAKATQYFPFTLSLLSLLSYLSYSSSSF